jgi:hypothetical protein
MLRCSGLGGGVGGRLGVMGGELKLGRSSSTEDSDSSSRFASTRSAEGHFPSIFILMCFFINLEYRFSSLSISELYFVGIASKFTFFISAGDIVLLRADPTVLAVGALNSLLGTLNLSKNPLVGSYFRLESGNETGILFLVRKGCLRISSTVSLFSGLFTKIFLSKSQASGLASWNLGNSN